MIQSLSIAEFCKTGTGGTPSRKQLDLYYEGGTIPWVKSGELRDEVIYETEEHVTELALEKTNVKLIPAGTLLLAMYGATVGRVGILGVPAATNQAVCHIIPDESKAFTRYLYHAIKSKLSFLLGQRVGGAQPNISQSIVKSVIIPLPPLEEQRRIAAILDQAEALRAKRRQAIAQLDALTQSIFIDMFGDPLQCVKRWGSTQVKDLFELKNGVNFSAEQRGEGYLVLDVLNMYTDSVYVDTDNLYRVDMRLPEDKVLREGDILFVRSSVKREGVGWPALFRELDEPVTYCGFIIRARPDGRLRQYNNKFLVHYFRHPIMRSKMISSSGQVAITNINQARLGDLPIPKVPFDQQQAFADQVSAIERMRLDQDQAIAKLDDLFASLQHRAFRGEL